MSDPQEHQSANASTTSKPEQAVGNGKDAESAIRVAKAAENIAAELGVLARVTEKIEQHLAKIAVRFPPPGSAEEVMQNTL